MWGGRTLRVHVGGCAVSPHATHTRNPKFAVQRGDYIVRQGEPCLGHAVVMSGELSAPLCLVHGPDLPPR